MTDAIIHDKSTVWSSKALISKSITLIESQKEISALILILSYAKKYRIVINKLI